jgi:hypothetical protein
MAVTVATLALAPVLSAAPPMRVALLEIAGQLADDAARLRLPRRSRANLQVRRVRQA